MNIVNSSFQFTELFIQLLSEIYSHPPSYYSTKAIPYLREEIYPIAQLVCEKSRKLSASWILVRNMLKFSSQLEKPVQASCITLEDVIFMINELKLQMTLVVEILSLSNLSLERGEWRDVVLQCLESIYQDESSPLWIEMFLNWFYKCLDESICKRLLKSEKDVLTHLIALYQQTPILNATEQLNKIFMEVIKVARKEKIVNVEEEFDENEERKSVSIRTLFSVAKKKTSKRKRQE